MSNWIPTNELRFVEREENVHEAYDLATRTEYVSKRTLRILQQKWVSETLHIDIREWEFHEEWRDVPVESEECYAIET